MGEPATGYSWPQFKDGNEDATKHGADSVRRWRPIAERLAAELLAERPWLAGHRRTVDAWARVEAQAQLVGDWLDTHGMLDEDGEPRAACNRLDRLESRAQSLRNDLAETPMAMARLLSTLTSTAVAAGATDTVAALTEDGRRFVDAWRAKQAVTADHPSAALPAPDSGAQVPESGGGA